MGNKGNGQAEYETERVQVTLTDEVRYNYNNRLVDVLHEQEEVELELEGVKSDFKERLKKLQIEQHTLKEKLRNGYEFVEVECRWEMDHHRGVAWLVRMDNDVRVRSRTMTQDEKQARMQF